MKKTCAYKLCGEIGHNNKENKDEYPHKRRISKGVSRESQGTSVGECSQRFCCSNGSSVYIVGKIHEAQKDDKEIAEVKERMSK